MDILDPSLLLIAGLVGALVGVFIARSKGRSVGEGFLLGGFLGPIGWLIMLLLPGGEAAPRSDRRPVRKCPFCAEIVLQEARVCKHCRREIPAR